MGKFEKLKNQNKQIVNDIKRYVIFDSVPSEPVSSLFGFSSKKVIR